MIEYGGTEHRIDGAPSLFDYQSFIEALDKALHETLAAAAGNQPRWNAFAGKVLCGAQASCSADNPGNRAMLKSALADLVQWEDRVEAVNKTSLRYGYARVDAFGHIFNKVSLFANGDAPTPNAASAPVSYPFLWDIYRHDKLQWNGIAQSKRLKLGATSSITARWAATRVRSSACSVTSRSPERGPQGLQVQRLGRQPRPDGIQLRDAQGAGLAPRTAARSQPRR